MLLMGRYELVRGGVFFLRKYYDGFSKVGQI